MTNHYRRFAFSGLLLAGIAALTLVLAAPAWAGPVLPDPVTLSQPDGTPVSAFPFGDEWDSGYETAAGYTIVQEPASGYWVFAVLDPAGQLAPGAQKACGGAAPSDAACAPAGLKPHLRDARANLPQARSPRKVGARSLAQHAGSEPVLVLLVGFADRGSVGTGADQWATRFFGPTDSVADYYREVSYGQLTLTPAGEGHGTANDGVVGWLVLPYNHPDTRKNTGNPNRQIVRDALVLADPYVNFAIYDADGDGFISASELHIVTIIAGYETSYGGAAGACTPSIWAHEWSLGFSYAGAYVDAPQLDGKSVANVMGGGGYVQTGEWHCSNSDTPGHMSTIGVVAHEMGHDISWPDLYDVDGSSNGVGYWSVMSGGSWRYSSGYSGSKPAHPDAFLKWYQGWLTPEQVAGERENVLLAAVETSGRVLQLRDNPGGVDWEYGYHAGAGEYFLIENRQQTGYDAGLPGCGLLIWHIDETRSFDNNANANDSRRLVDLEEADGRNDLDLRANSGDAGDPYPGTAFNLAFGPATAPDSNLAAGGASGVSVEVKSACAATMRVDVDAPDGPTTTPTRTATPSATRTRTATATRTPTASTTPGACSAPRVRLPLILRSADGNVPTVAPSATHTPTATATPTRTPTNTPTPVVTWTVMMREGFEGAFPTGSWRVGDNDGTDGGEYTFAKRDCLAFAGAFSGWAIGGGSDGANLECNADYANSLTTYMMYGPFSLAGATGAEVRLQAWINSEDGYDWLKILASLNGTHFYGTELTGEWQVWQDASLNLGDVPTLGNLTGQTSVWIAIVFQSDPSVTLSTGAYVDDIVLRKCSGGACGGLAAASAGLPAEWIRQ